MPKQPVAAHRLKVDVAFSIHNHSSQLGLIRVPLYFVYQLLCPKAQMLRFPKQKDGETMQNLETSFQYCEVPAVQCA